MWCVSYILVNRYKKITICQITQTSQDPGVEHLPSVLCLTLSVIPSPKRKSKILREKRRKSKQRRSCQLMDALLARRRAACTAEGAIGAKRGVGSRGHRELLQGSWQGREIEEETRSS